MAQTGYCVELPSAARVKKTRILCSVFPVWLFARNVTSGSLAVQLDLMLPAAMGCPHDYVLTPQDMEKIALADVLIINGLGLEEFIGAPLKKANPKIVVIDACKEISPMMMKSEGDGHGDAHLHSEANPHLFASPRMAGQMVSNIAIQLAKIVPAEAQLYARNAASYSIRLTRLGEELSGAVRQLRARRVMTTHAVFDYLAGDAGLEIAAVIEETPGQEPSAADMLRLIKTIKESKVAAVFTEPQYPDRTARTIAREAGAPVAALDPVASGPQGAPMDYYEQAMRRNVKVLKETLGGTGRVKE